MSSNILHLFNPPLFQYQNLILLIWFGKLSIKIKVQAFCNNVWHLIASTTVK